LRERVTVGRFIAFKSRFGLSALLSSPHTAHHVHSSTKFDFSHLLRRPSNSNAKCYLVSLSRHGHRILGRFASTLSSFHVVHSRPDSVSIQVSSRFPASRDASFKRLVWVCNSIYTLLAPTYIILREWNEQNASKKDSDSSAATSGARDKRCVIHEVQCMAASF
jgi:hypothetical protein